jgi:hypothetical protein
MTILQSVLGKHVQWEKVEGTETPYMSARCLGEGVLVQIAEGQGMIIAGSTGVVTTTVKYIDKAYKSPMFIVETQNSIYHVTVL